MRRLLVGLLALGSLFALPAFGQVNGGVFSPAPTDVTMIFSDNTSNNVSITKHGFAPKAPNDATKYLDGTGAWTVPAGTGITASSTNTLTNKTYDTAGTGNSFSINGVAVTANTGTGAVARAAAPTFTTPTLGVAAATTVNKITITTPASGATLTIPDGVTLNAGAGGTLGSNAFTSTAYAPLAAPAITGSATFTPTGAARSFGFGVDASATTIPILASNNVFSDAGFTGWADDGTFMYLQAGTGYTGIKARVASVTVTQTDASGFVQSSGTTQLKGYTVSTLPSTAGAGKVTGATAYVTDAVACTFLASLTGGGSTFCPVNYTGAAWVGG